MNNYAHFISKLDFGILTPAHPAQPAQSVTHEKQHGFAKPLNRPSCFSLCFPIYQNEQKNAKIHVRPSCPRHPQQ